MYRVEISKSVLKYLKKLDKYTQRILLDYIESKLDGCTNPRAFGKALTGDKTGQWRYRVGDYRILARIKDNILLILVIDIGHRSEIYKI